MPLGKIALPPAFAPAFVLAAVVAGSGEARANMPQIKAPEPSTALRLDGPALVLLGSFRNAEIERPGPTRLYLTGRWGQWSQRPLFNFESVVSGAPESRVTLDIADGMDEALDPEADDGLEAWPAPADAEPTGIERWLAPLSRIWGGRAQALPFANARWEKSSIAALGGFDLLQSVASARASQPPPPTTTPKWCRRRPVKFVRYGGESDAIPLLGCDGVVAAHALDRLTLMARPPEVPRPGELLPDEPDPEAWQRGEWLDGVRPVHPRLLWLLQRIADAYPWRVIYVYSGYRPKGSSAKSQHSLHGEARAMDISVYGVRNEDLFRYCRTLDDVGCGYYPNSKFVHVDVRKPGTGHAFWVDASAPGEPSRYVDAWPGVIESGGLAWDARARAAQASEPYDASPVTAVEDAR